MYTNRTGSLQRRYAGLLTAAGLALLLCAVTAAAAAAGTGPAAATGRAGARGALARLRADLGDAPAGFLYGTDSLPVTISGSAPYQEPRIGGDYGGYIGMAGSWSHWLGCKNGIQAWSGTDSQDANTNFSSYHVGIGTGVYWFMGGPGVDPKYNGTRAEAYSWGESQAQRALYDISHLSVKYPVVFMDVELPGIAPAPDNGWNSVYTSPCSGSVKQDYVAADVDRSDFNGFAAYLTSHSSYKAGVYSAAPVWNQIFGTGSDSDVPNTYMWTYTGDTSSLSDPPDGWCLAGTKNCAHFFGGISEGSPYALMWQWSGGGGTYNGVGDFDQIDVSRTP